METCGKWWKMMENDKMIEWNFRVDSRHPLQFSMVSRIYFQWCQFCQPKVETQASNCSRHLWLQLYFCTQDYNRLHESLNLNQDLQYTFQTVMGGSKLRWKSESHGITLAWENHFASPRHQQRARSWRSLVAAENLRSKWFYGTMVTGAMHRSICLWHVSLPSKHPPEFPAKGQTMLCLAKSSSNSQWNLTNHQSSALIEVNCFIQSKWNFLEKRTKMVRYIQMFQILWMFFNISFTTQFELGIIPVVIQYTTP